MKIKATYDPNPWEGWAWQAWGRGAQTAWGWCFLTLRQHIMYHADPR